MPTRFASSPAGFYRGTIANEIVTTLHEGGNPITSEDLAGFEPRWRRPVCTVYRGRTVLSAPPPQSGMQVLEALNLLAPYDLVKLGLPSRSPEAFRVLTAALRVSVTDRNAYVGDPTFSPVPAAGLVSPSYAGERKALLALDPVPDTMRAGNPWSADSIAPATGCASFEPFGPSKVPPRVAELPRDGSDSGNSETTHLSAVDSDGNAVALTYTNGLFFGSGTWVAGTFLNSAMFNFSRDDSSANARGPHRVPSSTISPTIVLRDGRAELVVGSPGVANLGQQLARLGRHPTRRGGEHHLHTRLRSRPHGGTPHAARDPHLDYQPPTRGRVQPRRGGGRGRQRPGDGHTIKCNGGHAKDQGSLI